MSEQERAESQAATTAHVGGGATDSDREAVAREIGAQLKEARETQRMSLEDVSARLKVASAKLAAIESGNVSSLLDVTFAKGVMRAYARSLHVDIDMLLGRYHAQAQAMPVAEITRRHEGALNQTFDDRKRFGTRSAGGSGGRLVWLFLVVAGLAAGGYFGFDHAKAWLEARNKAAAEAPAVAEEHETAPQSNNDGTVTAALPPVMAGNDSPAPSEAPPASVAGMPLATGGALGPSEAAPAAPEAPVIKAASAPAAPVAKVAPASAAAAATATTAAPAVAKGDGQVQIRFSADSWYEVRDRSGKVILGGTAKAGDAVSGTGAGGPYKVILGNVKGVESMTRNGAPVDFQSANRNNVARLTLQ
ncbi:cytoskeleton protein RodZ [Cupriavidus sp. YR651]|uniref:RodZ domain-containing protein n=1 Tax=Cupriavidus sp. YR651 TaxID=1855315 RepID=UPI000880F523|nr:RodZ domain-containing protein [Cupriavidus sp. YR651]SDC07532.1 cytoskeleton protein RodZ [Cupriavidus sp. YR651]